MGKITIDSIAKMHKEDEIARAHKMEELEQLRQKRAALQDRLVEDAQYGVEALRATRAEIADIDDQILVDEAQLNHSSYTINDAIEAWEESSKPYNKGLEKDLADYNKQKADLAKTYENIVRKQNKRLQDRECLAQLAGVSPVRAGVDGAQIEYPPFPMRYIPEGPVVKLPSKCQVETPELSFFVGSGVWKMIEGVPSVPVTDSVTTLNHIVRRHIPIDDPQF